MIPNRSKFMVVHNTTKRRCDMTTLSFSNQVKNYKSRFETMPLEHNNFIV